MLEKDASKICIVDDDSSIREALTTLFSPLYVQVETYASGPEFLARYMEDGPACLVLDLRMPGMSGLGVQSELLERNVRIPIVFLTACNDIHVAVRAMKAGAVDFIRKPYAAAELVDAVDEAVAIARRQFVHDVGRRAFEGNLMKLTPRECDVLSHVLQGHSNKVIAYQLGISQKTVEVHRSNMLQKMGTGSAIELIALALRFPEALWHARGLQPNHGGADHPTSRATQRVRPIDARRPSYPASSANGRRSFRDLTLSRV